MLSVDQGLRKSVAHSVWQKSPFRAFLSFSCENVLSRELLSLASLICRACNPAGGGCAHHSVRGSAWLQQISGVQLLAFQSPACRTCRSSRPNLSPVYSPLHTSHFGLDPTVLSALLYLNSFCQSCCACMHMSTGSLLRLESHLSSSFKRVSVWPPHCSTKPRGACSPCTSPLQKSQSLSQ